MSGDFLYIDDMEMKGKTVLLRVDINSPLDPSGGHILDDTRIRMHVPTIKALEETKLVVLGHQSRPGKEDFTSLEPHSVKMSQNLGKRVIFSDELFGRTVMKDIRNLEEGDVLLLENTRLYSEEIALKDPDLEDMRRTHIVKKLGSVTDMFVNDAFAAAHRAQTTLVGFGEVMPMIAGKLMEKEIKALGGVVDSRKRPVIGILGGAKIDDSIEIAKNMLDKGKVDKIIATGVVGNAFLLASRKDIGKGNKEFIMKVSEDPKRTMKTALLLTKSHEDEILLPIDVAVEKDGRREEVPVDELKGCKYPIYDIGIESIDMFSKEIKEAKYLFLNGPAGYFEKREFSIGTNQLFKAIADSKAYSVIGGGHTGAVVEAMGLKDKIDHISSGGGSFINFLAGRKMPVIEALKKSKERYENGYYEE